MTHFSLHWLGTTACTGLTYWVDSTTIVVIHGFSMIFLEVFCIIQKLLINAFTLSCTDPHLNLNTHRTFVQNVQASPQSVIYECVAHKIERPTGTFQHISELQKFKPILTVAIQASIELFHCPNCGSRR